LKYGHADDFCHNSTEREIIALQMLRDHNPPKLSPTKIINPIENQQEEIPYKSENKTHSCDISRHGRQTHTGKMRFGQ
jgi:hypothetical protein